MLNPKFMLLLGAFVVLLFAYNLPEGRQSEHPGLDTRFQEYLPSPMDVPKPTAASLPQKSPELPVSPGVKTQPTSEYVRPVPYQYNSSGRYQYNNNNNRRRRWN